jgi:hypothetical protein
LTNNIEEILTIFMLASFPLKNQNNFKIFSKNSFWAFHFIAFISFSIRATAAINLAPIYIYLFFNSKSKLQFLQEFFSIGYE